MELIDLVQDATYFTKFDVQWGFNNVQIWEGDKYKAAFITHQGLFKPMVMMFSLCNAVGISNRSDSISSFIYASVHGCMPMDT
jgi:hypothetical protein